MRDIRIKRLNEEAKNNPMGGLEDLQDEIL